MTKLEEVLNYQEDVFKDSFEKCFKKIFGIPAEIEARENNIFQCYNHHFSLDHEGNLVWKYNNTWQTILSLYEAKQLWQN